MKFHFQAEDASLLEGLDIIKKHYNFTLSDGGRALKAVKVAEGMRAHSDGDGFVVEYSSKELFFMGFSYCMQNYERGAFEVKKQGSIKRLGIMRDCARNAILSLDGFEKLAVYCALTGYNYIELYAEDLMEIEGLPYLGHTRGRYSKMEIRTMDKIALALGIELVPCIQTLAHLSQIFRHDAFAPIRDIDDILLVGSEQTYEFIEKVVAFAAENYRSRNINIGMDEAHNMLLGEYLRKNGYEQDRGKVFMQHLSRVLEICRKYGFKPCMWSDMFFKVGLDVVSWQSYTGIEGRSFSREFIQSVPRDVTLVFWDYYHCDEAFYDQVFERHLELTDNISFAGGVWTWMGFAPGNTYAQKTLLAAIASCKRHNIKDFKMTAWGDNGGECSTFAAAAQLLRAAEELYSTEVTVDALNVRAQFVLGNTFEELMAIENANLTAPDSIEVVASQEKKLQNPCKYLLYNDPLCGTFDAHCYPELAGYFKRNSEELASYARKNGRLSYLYQTLQKLCSVLEIKATLGIDITKAYKDGDIAALKKLSEHSIPECIARVNEFYKAFRFQWHSENKSYGFEVSDIRIGGLLKRLENTKQIIDDYVAGSISVIEELEQKRLPVSVTTSKGEDLLYNHYLTSATGSIL